MMMKLRKASKIISSSDETKYLFQRIPMASGFISFEIDEGSAKITSLEETPISYISTDPWAQDGWQDYFYINKNVLKFAQYSYYDYDTDEYKLFLGPAIYGSDWQFHDLQTSNVRDNEFSITFEYKNNGKLKIIKFLRLL